MGNSLGGKKKSAKVMKINGETFKLKTPVQAGEVVKDYPGHVLLESEAVKHFGVRAMPLEFHQELKPKRLYFLVELPSFPEERRPRRVRSGINMSAKDRLESLMLSRRSVSDLSTLNPSIARVTMRLPKAEVAKFMMESKDEAEAAEKIMNFCMENGAVDGGGAGGGAPPSKGNELPGCSVLHQAVQWKGGHGSVKDGFKARGK